MPTANFEKLDTARMAHIISVALDEFARHRYQDASFNRIIRNCGIAKGTMYYYFQSKEDLYLTLYKATMREFAPIIKRAQQPLTQSSDVWLVLCELIEGLWHVLRSKPTIGLFVSNGLIPGLEEEQHPGLATREKLQEWLLSLARKAQELGAWRSDLSAEALVALLWGLWSSLRAQMGCLGHDGSFLQAPAQLFDLSERLLSPVPQWAQRSLAGSDLRTGEARL